MNIDPYVSDSVITHMNVLFNACVDLLQISLLGDFIHALMSCAYFGVS